MLNDPLSSRVHAIIECREGVWWVYDAQSRNGTYVNQQKADEAQLIDGCQLRVGSTEFEFSQSPDRPPDVSLRDPTLTQTIVRDTPIKPGEPADMGVGSLQDTSRAQDFLLLHQLSIRLLGVEDPDEVVRISLDLLHTSVRRLPSSAFCGSATRGN